MASKKNKTYNLYISLALLAFINLLSIYLFKYAYNSLTLFDLNLFKTGNFLNLLVTVLTIAGAFILYFKRSELRVSLFLLIMLYLISIVMVLAADIVAFFDVINSDAYVFGYPIGKLMMGAVLSGSVFLNLYVLVTIWILIVDSSYYTLLKSLIVTCVLVFIGIGATLYLNITFNEKSGMNEAFEKIDLAVVLGAAVYSDNQPSPIFMQRIEKAHELLNDGKIEKILLTGSNAPGEITESESAFQYLSSLGVKSDRIILEKETTTTSEQIRYIKNRITGSTGNKGVIVISDEFHLKRVMEMCDFFDVNAYGVASGYKLNWEKLLYYRVRDSIGLLLFWLFAI
jgi:vancomycin permeability regulator SanA